MRQAILQFVSSVLVVVMVMSACGDSSVDLDDAATAASELETGQAAPEADDPTDDEPDDDPEPGETAAAGAPSEKRSLEDYLGIATGFVRGGGGGGVPAGGLDLERLAQEQQLIQLEVQRCMLQQGFEYTPEQTGQGIRLFGGAEAQGLSDADYAATEGFGITTRFDSVFEGDIDLTSDEPSENEILLESLSEGEVDAWQFALRGAPPERNAQGQLVDPETGEVIQDGQPGPTGGCVLDAQVAVRGDFSVLSELEDEFELLDERIAADLRIAEIAADWTACMRGRGFAYETVGEARGDFQQQFFPLLVAFFRGSGLQPQVGQGRAGQAANLQALADHGLSDEQEAELAALQDLEIAAAVASLECAGDTQIEIDEITARYEADFVDTNRSTLERIGG